MRRRVLQWVTAALLVLCVWTAYANVLSDDTEVRAKARVAVHTAAGCGDNCKLEGFRGERGMITEEITYDVIKHGQYVVACRRAFISFGEYTCVVTQGATGAAPSASATPSASSSATKR